MEELQDECKISNVDNNLIDNKHKLFGPEFLLVTVLIPDR